MKFQNNLQRVLHKRNMFLARSIGFCIIIVVFLMLRPNLGYAASSLSECADPFSGESEVVPENATWYLWYVGEAFSYNGVCVIAWSTSSSPEDRDIYYNASDTGYNYWEGLVTGMTAYSWDGDGYDTSEPLITNSHRSILASVDIASGNNVQSSSNLLAGSANGTDYDGATGIYDLGELMLAGEEISSDSGTLTYSGSTVVQLGTSIYFTAGWQDLEFSPYYLYFFEGGEDIYGLPIIDNYPEGTTGNWSFQHTYDYAGSYIPYAVLGSSGCDTITSTGSVTGSGCTTFDLVSTTLTVNTELESSDDISYPSTLTGSKYDDIFVGENIDFTYNIDDPCTVTGKRFFKGYSSALSYLDSGAVLPVESAGTHEIIFNRTNQPYSDYFYPYINLYCDDETSRQLYVGGSWNYKNARGVSVYTQAEIEARSEAIIPMLNGGASDNFSSSSGSLFTSSKRVYDKYEPVHLELNYHVDFTPDTAYIYPSGTGSAGFTFGSGSDSLQQGNDIRFNIHYEDSGFYDPVIVIRASGGTPYKVIYLGGESYPSPYYQIYVTKSIWNSIANLFDTTDGIFGLDPSTFRVSFFNSNNVFLSDVNEGLNKIMSAGLKVAGIVYNILKSSPILSFFTEIINPPDGGTYMFPSKIGDTDILLRPSTIYATVDYADEDSGFANLEIVVKLLVAASFILFVFRTFFRPKW